MGRSTGLEERPRTRALHDVIIATTHKTNENKLRSVSDPNSKKYREYLSPEAGQQARPPTRTCEEHRDVGPTNRRPGDQAHKNGEYIIKTPLVSGGTKLWGVRSSTTRMKAKRHR